MSGLVDVLRMESTGLFMNDRVLVENLLKGRKSKPSKGEKKDSGKKEEKVVDAEFEDADSITVSVSNHELTNLDFSADLDLIVETIPEKSGSISGTVTFAGDFPDGTVFISLNSLWPLQTTPNYYSTISSKNLILGGF